MTEQSTTGTTVLVVEDEQSLANLYAEWLTDEYTVRTAYSGEQAIKQLDESIDVVLLDRRMPGLSGDEVLTRIREQQLTCRVVMVTAVDPDFDIIDLKFDEYLTKPIDADELRTTVERMERLATYNDVIQELHQCVATRAALQAEKSDAELRKNEAYATLQTRIEALQQRADAEIAGFDTDDFEAAFRDRKIHQRES